VVVLKKVASSGSVSGNFTCYNGNTVWGQNVYVVGNQPELGNWDAASAVKLDATSYPTWTGTISSLPSNTTIEWKCIKRDVGAVEWQAGSNNSVTTSSSGSVNTSGSF
jgi:hypothetical protein